MSPEEYLAFDREAEVKNEYFNGRMYAMSGGSFAHSVIGPNMMGELRSVLKGADCRVSSDLRLRVAPMVCILIPMRWWCAESQSSRTATKTLCSTRF